MRKLLLLALFSLGAFDFLLGLACIMSPGTVAGIFWPSAAPDALIMLRRTGISWLFLGVVQLAAFARPGDPNRLRLVALLRGMDGLSDAVWLASRPALNSFGWVIIILSPPLSLLFGWLLWRESNTAR